MTRIANSTEAVRRTKLLDRIQAEDFARMWREGRRDEVLARYAEPAFCRVATNVEIWDDIIRPRPAFGHIPYPHRTCSEWITQTGAPRVGPPSGFDSPSPEGGSSSGSA